MAAPSADPLIVRYAWWAGIRINWAAFGLLGVLWWYDGLTFLWPLTAMLLLGAASALVDLAVALDRRPMLVIAPDGITVPNLDGEFIAWTDLDSFWLTRKQDGHAAGPTDAWWRLSLQCRPRRRLSRAFGAWRRYIRTDTLLEGDIAFDLRFLAIDPAVLTAALKRHHPGGWLDSRDPLHQLDWMLPGTDGARPERA